MCLFPACPADPAFGETVNCDFTKGACGAFQAAQGTTIKYDSQGAVFTINSEKDAPTIHTDKFIFFGEIEVEVQAAPGQGIVTSAVLQSDDLDEVRGHSWARPAPIARLTSMTQIDFEWIGSDTVQVQSNYFSKGDTTTYDRGAYHQVTDSVGKSHTYGIKWTPEAITWSVDGAVLRTLRAADAKGGDGFPQTPMQIKLGTWVAGGKDAPEGTVKWAGGHTDFSQKPFVGIYKRIKIVDYAGKSEAATGGIKEYVYGDKTGAAKSIKVVQGKSDSKQVHGENGITGGEGKDNGSSSHNEAKSVLDDSSSTDASSATRRPSATSGGPLQTGTSTGDQGVKPKTTLATAAGGSNSTATARPSKGPDDTVPTSAAGRAVASFGALAVAAAFTALLL